MSVVPLRKEHGSCQQSRLPTQKLEQSQHNVVTIFEHFLKLFTSLERIQEIKEKLFPEIFFAIFSKILLVTITTSSL